MERETVVFLAALVGLTASCGSRTTIDDSEDSDIGVDGECRPSSNSFPSGEAVTLARCRSSLPSGAVLSSIANMDELDSAGGATTWCLGFVGAGKWYQGCLLAKKGGVQALEAFGDHFYCNTSIDEVATSNTILPDAINRLQTRGVDLVDPPPLFFYGATGDCPGLNGTEAVHISLPRPTGDEGPSKWWDVYYDTTGRYQRICGPCLNKGDSACTTCSQ